MVTISLKFALTCLVLAALLVLIVILCIIAYRLIKTVDELNKVLEDASVVSEVAANTATQVDGIVDDVGAAANRLRSSSADSGMLGAVSNVARAVSSVAGRGRGSADQGQKQKRKSRR